MKVRRKGLCLSLLQSTLDPLLVVFCLPLRILIQFHPPSTITNSCEAQNLVLKIETKETDDPSEADLACMDRFAQSRTRLEEVETEHQRFKAEIAEFEEENQALQARAQAFDDRKDLVQTQCSCFKDHFQA